jgi:hypothetical protein
MHSVCNRDAFRTSVMQCDAFPHMFYKLHFLRKVLVILPYLFAII